MNKKRFKELIPALIPILVVGIISLCLLPFANDFLHEENRDALIGNIRSSGYAGVFAMIGIQVAQVVLFVIPGEVVEVIAGMIFGTLWGFIICNVGIILGSTLVFLAVKKIGYNTVSRLFPKENYKILSDESRILFVVFILFFIPGTPKDALTYLVPFTGIKLHSFLIISVVARIPSVLSSTYIGATLQEGNFTLAIVLYAVVGVISLIGIYIERRWRRKRED